jgi:hypothetical protein
MVLMALVTTLATSPLLGWLRQGEMTNALPEAGRS